jgi:hypothetical protein
VQRKRLGAAEADYAAAATERDQAEELLGAHQHRLADLQADLERLSDQLELTHQSLRDAANNSRGCSAASTRPARNAAAIGKRRDAEQRRLNALNPDASHRSLRRGRGETNPTSPTDGTSVPSVSQ